MHPGGGAQPTTQGPPDVRYFKGSVAGAPGSTVVLAVDAAGGVSGMAMHGSERWALGRPALAPQAAAAGVAPAGLASRRAGGSATTSGHQHFHCGASNLEAPRPPRAQQAQQAQPAGSQGGDASRKLLAVRLHFSRQPHAAVHGPDRVLLSGANNLGSICRLPSILCIRPLRALHRWQLRRMESCISAWEAQRH